MLLSAKQDEIAALYPNVRFGEARPVPSIDGLSTVAWVAHDNDTPITGVIYVSAAGTPQESASGNVRPALAQWVTNMRAWIKHADRPWKVVVRQFNVVEEYRSCVIIAGTPSNPTQGLLSAHAVFFDEQTQTFLSRQLTNAAEFGIRVE